MIGNQLIIITMVAISALAVIDEHELRGFCELQMFIWYWSRILRLCLLTE